VPLRAGPGPPRAYPAPGFTLLTLLTPRRDRS